MVFKVCVCGGGGSVTSKGCLKMPHDWELLLEFNKKSRWAGVLNVLHWVESHTEERSVPLQMLVSILL